MRKTIGILTLIFGLIFLLITSCKKDEINNDNAKFPVLTTSDINDITLTSANCGGNISSDGGSAVTAKGVCWSTEQSPTITNSKTADGTGTGNFSSIVDDLTSNTTYYIRAYATNEVGTAYGNEVSFTTNHDIIPEFNVMRIIDDKEIRNIIKTSDGGYIGIAYSLDYDIIKFDANFNMIWNKIYGGSDGDYVQSIIQTIDGGYLVIGVTKSNDGDVTINHGGYDIWICKLDTEGNLIWEKSYGGSNGDGVGAENSLIQTNDGGYIFIGYTKSEDGDISLNHGGYDAWLVKINSMGAIEFEKTYGGSEDDYGRKIIETNSNYVISIKANSDGGDFSASGNWIFRIDENGMVVWKTNLGSVNSGFINASMDDEIIVINTNADEFLLSKLDLNGNVILSKIINFQATYAKQPFAAKIIQTLDKGYIVIGSLGNGDESDAILFRLTNDLSLTYQKIYNGNKWEFSTTLIPIGDNEFVYSFCSNSSDIVGFEPYGVFASVIVKLDEFSD